MEVLFATTNPSKIEHYKKQFEEKGIKILTLKDIKVNAEVKEIGNNAIENAKIKAKTYFDLAGITTICIDDNLFIDNIPEEQQPGTHVRRVNGKTLTDEEMIKHYTELVKKNGNRLTAQWVKGIAIYNGNEFKTYSWKNSKFYLVDKPAKERHPGYPLDSISIIPEFDKYLVELTSEEKEIRNKDKSNKDGDISQKVYEMLKEWN